MNQEIYQPSMVLLNMSGDITISWDESNEEAMLSLIEQKLQAGYSFFILKPRFLSLLGKKKVRATSVAEIAEAGSAVIADADFHRMLGKLKLHDPAVEAAVAGGHARLAKSEGAVDHTTIRRTSNAAEIVRHQTIAIRPIVGG